MAARSTAPEDSYRLYFDNRPGYFYVRIACGDLELKTSKRIVLLVVEELRKTDHKKLLVKLDVGERLSLADSFWLAFYYCNLLSEGDRIAVVDGIPGHDELNHFADAAANNLDLKRQTFHSVEDAEQWLASN